MNNIKLNRIFIQFYLRSHRAPRPAEKAAAEKKPQERKVYPMVKKIVNSQALDIPLRRPSWREDR